jgi:hypothetical protein
LLQVKLEFVFARNGDAKMLNSCLVVVEVLADCCEIGIDVPLGVVVLFEFLLGMDVKGTSS